MANELKLLGEISEISDWHWWNFFVRFGETFTQLFFLKLSPCKMTDRAKKSAYLQSLENTDFIKYKCLVSKVCVWLRMQVCCSWFYSNQVFECLTSPKKRKVEFVNVVINKICIFCVFVLIETMLTCIWLWIDFLPQFFYHTQKFLLPS